jgi:hypothetical protein
MLENVDGYQARQTERERSALETRELRRPGERLITQSGGTASRVFDVHLPMTPITILPHHHDV